VTAHLPPAVAVRDLHVRFGTVEAVNGLDLEMQAGQATIGPGAAGSG
jgi:ABC-type branched-subunit amino acid transport system ATPase component